LLRNFTEKVVNLRELLSNYKTSEYRDDAMYELGRAYERLNQNADATVLYSDIIKNYKQSSYYKKALLQLGLINYNNGNYTESIRLYKEVAEKYPNTEEATAALSGIKNCYVELNDVDSYFAYAQQLGRGTVSATEQDAMIYKAAERQFMAGEKDAAAKLKRYLTEFPYGAYVLNARFYLAEALYNSGNLAEAYEHYQYVAGQTDNIFTEPAVSKAAELAFNRKDYSNALTYFKHLETVASSPFNKLNAYTGQMRCCFELKNYREAILAAQQVQQEEKTNAQLLRDAGYILAKSEYNLGEFDKALPSFKKLSSETNTAEGSEARFIVADLHFRKQQYKQAEDEIMDFISKGTPHQYWLGKCFILLSDIYVANNDAFQAKHTLKSVIENYSNKTDGIVADATARLANIEAKEKSAQ
jgi:TolA-binding protein